MTVESQAKTFLSLAIIIITSCIFALYALGTSASNEAHLDKSDESSQPQKVSDIPSTHLPEPTSQLCVLALNSRTPRSLSLSAGSSIEAKDCAVHANSSLQDNNGELGSLNINAKQVSTTAGSQTHPRIANEQSIQEVEFVSDPLKNMALPTTQGCDAKNLRIKSAKASLKPGTYCGGIIAIGNYEITLEPGIYHIKNGPVVLGGKSVIKGDGVTLFFENSRATLSVGVSTKLDLTAPKKGPTAGMLFMADAPSKGTREFMIRSRRASNLNGVIYLPKSRLVLNGTGRIASKSNWTRIVAGEIELIGDAKLVINSDFANSEVPLPNAMKSINQNFNIASVSVQ